MKAETRKGQFEHSELYVKYRMEGLNKPKSIYKAFSTIKQRDNEMAKGLSNQNLFISLKKKYKKNIKEQVIENKEENKQLDEQVSKMNQNMRIGVEKVNRTIDYYNQMYHKYNIRGLDNQHKHAKIQELINELNDYRIEKDHPFIQFDQDTRLFHLAQDYIERKGNMSKSLIQELEVFENNLMNGHTDTSKPHIEYLKNGDEYKLERKNTELTELTEHKSNDFRRTRNVVRLLMDNFKQQNQVINFAKIEDYHKLNVPNEKKATKVNICQNLSNRLEIHNLKDTFNQINKLQSKNKLSKTAAQQFMKLKVKKTSEELNNGQKQPSQSIIRKNSAISQKSIDTTKRSLIRRNSSKKMSTYLGKQIREIIEVNDQNISISFKQLNATVRERQEYKNRLEEKHNSTRVRTRIDTKNYSNSGVSRNNTRFITEHFKSNYIKNNQLKKQYGSSLYTIQ